MYELLIVDDDPQVLRVIVDGLEFRGLTAWPAQNANEALELQRSHQLKYVLMDMNLGSKEWDGIKLGKALCSIDPEISIMIMTGYPDMEMLLPQVRELRFGYLVKPFRLDQVLIWLDQCHYIKEVKNENDLLKTRLEEVEAENAELCQQIAGQSGERASKPRISHLEPTKGQKPNRYLIESYKKNSR